MPVNPREEHLNLGEADVSPHDNHHHHIDVHLDYLRDMGHTLNDVQYVLLQDHIDAHFMELSIKIDREPTNRIAPNYKGKISWMTW